MSLVSTNSLNMKLKDIQIRKQLNPGDLGIIAHLHGKIYAEEQDYGLAFDYYVGKSLLEFFEQYLAGKNAVWVAEYQSNIIGFLALMDRGEAAQLRFFLIQKAFRGLGLGKLLMNHFMDKLQNSNFKSCYLWTAEGLPASRSLYLRYGFTLTEQLESNTFGRTVLEQKYELMLS